MDIPPYLLVLFVVINLGGLESLMHHEAQAVYQTPVRIFSVSRQTLLSASNNSKTPVYQELTLCNLAYGHSAGNVYLIPLRV